MKPINILLIVMLIASVLMLCSHFYLEKNKSPSNTLSYEELKNLNENNNNKIIKNPVSNLDGLKVFKEENINNIINKNVPKRTREILLENKNIKNKDFYINEIMIKYDVNLHDARVIFSHENINLR